MIDNRCIRFSSSDLLELQTLLRQLVGQPFLFFRVSYGDELMLHLGESREFPGPKAKRLRRGSYVIGTRASTWYFRPTIRPALLAGLEDAETNAPERVERVDIRQIETGGYVQVGSTVLDVNVLRTAIGFGLDLKLSDGSTLLILPSPIQDDESKEEEIADWEVFTPYDRYLRVGPGFHWAYLDSSRSPGPTAEP